MEQAPRFNTLAVALALALVMGGSALSTAANELSSYDTKLRQLYARFDPVNPGRGVLDYPGNPVGDVAKSYAMIVLGELARERSGRLPELPSMLETAGYWLLENPNVDDAGHRGWGLPVAWDAYGDSTENPANSIYSISTAIVIDALLSWSEARTDAPHRRINEAVQNALDAFVEAPATPDGLLPYSLQPADREYDTFNSATYLAGQLQRFSQLTGDQSYSRAADQTMQSLLRNHKISDRGNWYWTYSIQEATSNDLPHATYIITGILDYARHGGRLVGEFDLEAVKGLMGEYVTTSFFAGTQVRSWPSFETTIKLPARSYDLGIAMALACRTAAHSDLREVLVDFVDRYRTPAGFLKYPSDALDVEPLIINEYEAYLWFGLMECAASVTPA